MTATMTTPIHGRPGASIIIPAYNEERVIRRCLDALLRDAEPGEFDIVVVCNGCSDGTEAAARSAGPGVRVFSIDQASKTAALNHGDRVANAFPRVYLDADLEVPAEDIRALVLPLRNPRRLAAIGYMDVELSGCSRPVRWFYRLWMLHPYLRQGKFGGVYALSRPGWLRRGPYPAVVADDTFVRERFSRDEYAAVDACRFRVFPPRTVPDVVRIRTRAYLGNRQLRAAAAPSYGSGGRSERRQWLRAVARRPDAWIGLPIYAAVNITAKARAARLYRRAQYGWLRDESSRQPHEVGSAA